MGLGTNKWKNVTVSKEKAATEQEINGFLGQGSNAAKGARTGQVQNCLLFLVEGAIFACGFNMEHERQGIRRILDLFT